MSLRALRRCILPALLLAAASTVFGAVQARVSGVVTDTQGNPLPDAVVTVTSDEVRNYEKVIEADKNGKFRIVIIDATRRYIFHVEAPGYQPQDRPIKVGIGTMDNFFEFELETLQEAVAAGEIEAKQQPGYKEFEEGRLLLRAGDHEGALVKFNEAVEAMPDLVPALNAVAELNFEAGRHEEALAAARKCLEQDDESAECLAIAVNSCQALGDVEAQAGYMARYQELNPEDPTVLFNEAVVFLNKMDDEGARPLLERCLTSDPDFPECNFEFGMLLLRIGDMEGAKSHLEKYLEVSPDGTDAATAKETIKYL
jgi:tetratricopeptide (TPR) repeat protein